MSYQDVAEKFLDCAAFAKWPVVKAKTVVEAVNHLDTMRDIRTLTTLLGS
jgi:hypothetical protein